MSDKLKVVPTWREFGGRSRYRTWTFGLDQIDRWFRQKKYPYRAERLAQKFAKKFAVAGSVTDAIIIAYQNFPEFRKFVNEYHKSKQNENSRPTEGRNCN
jgi:hypothetical protein